MLFFLEYQRKKKFCSIEAFLAFHVPFICVHEQSNQFWTIITGMQNYFWRYAGAASLPSASAFQQVESTEKELP